MEPKLQDVLRPIVHWCSENEVVEGVLLVGSWARGTARPDSDVDLVIVTPFPGQFRSDRHWAIEIGTMAGWMPLSERDADYGQLWSRHVVFDNGWEVEFGFATTSWADGHPMDPGTELVLRQGFVVLFDRQSRLTALSNGLEN